MRTFSCFCLVGLAGIGVLAQTTAPKNGSPALFTAKQVASGKLAYERSCVDCHGTTLDNGEFGGPPLRGRGFLRHWSSGTVAELFSDMKSTMPADRPGTLSDQAYADILAFILDGNGYPAGERELTPDLEALALLKLTQD